MATLVLGQGWLLSQEGCPEKKCPSEECGEKPVVAVAAASRTQRGGRGPEITKAIFSPDGKFALTVATYGASYSQMTLWELPSGKRVRDFERYGTVAAVAFSPDGKQVISGGEARRRNISLPADGLLIVWDVATGKRLKTFGLGKYEVSIIALSPDGKLAATMRHGPKLQLWDVATGREVRPLLGETGGGDSVAFSPDGKFLLEGGGDNSIRLWSVASGKQIRVLSDGGGRGWGVAFSTTGHFVISAGDTIKLWEVASGQEVLTLPEGVKLPLDWVAALPDGRHALTAGGGLPKLWDLRSGKIVRTYRWARISAGDRATLSPDGKRALFYHRDAVLLWDLVANEETCTLWPEGENAYAHVDYSRDGKWAVLAGADGHLQFWDIPKGRLVRKLNTRAGVDAFAVSPDGNLVLSAGGLQPGVVRLWSIATGKEVRALQDPEAFADGVACAAFSPDGKWIATGSNGAPETFRGALMVWEAATGKRVRSFENQKGAVYRVAFLPDGKRLLAYNSLWTLKIWEVPSGRLLRTSDMSREGKLLTIAPDGTQVLFRGYRLQIWDVISGKVLRALPQEFADIEAAAFSPDGKYLHLVGSRSLRRVVDAGSGKLVREFPQKGISSGSWALPFTPDGKLVHFNYSPPALRLYDPQSGQEMPRIAAKQGR
jgi:WD40 repeat protein